MTCFVLGLLYIGFELRYTLVHMQYENTDIQHAAEVLRERFANNTAELDVSKVPELKELFAQLPKLPAEQRAAFGKELNELRKELADLSHRQQAANEAKPAIDVTAPFDVNVAATARPALLPTTQGTKHPLMIELERVLDIFYRMGFTAVESPELDDDYHMFETLNFPEGHPARDSFDTFMTNQTDATGKQYIAPAHTSTMQNRVLAAHKSQLETDESIAIVIPGRTFRNEDLDARHEHTFYQLEGVYVGKGVHVGNLIATLKTFLQEYYGKELDVKTQPFYFPFTEPSFEFALSCPFCNKAGCKVCGEGWIELLGCGMIHPNVLKMAGIDPAVYTGYAWGGGIDRLVMMKYDIEDIRHFESGKLDFLEQF